MIYSSHFLPSDFIISSNDIPVIIVDRIFTYHLIPLNMVQDNVPFEVKVSQDSCYRPYIWEIARGRNGRSEHTFGQRKYSILNSKGACDITCEDFRTNKYALLDALIKNTDYVRFAVYNSFIHADYKDLYNGRKRLFENTNSGWKFKKFIT